MTHFPRTMVLLAACALAAAIAHAQELAPLPIAPTSEQTRAIASLSPFAEPIPRGMPPEDAKRTLQVFTSQGRWPIRIEYEDGSQYWGEVTEIGLSTFELFNRNTNQKTTLGYDGMRSVEIVEAYGAAGKYAQRGSSIPKHAPAPPLTPEELTYKRAVEHFALFDRRFVHCELKDHTVVTGAIVAVGPQDFIVRPGKLHEDRLIRYGDLAVLPRPTAANALEMTGLVAFCVVALPACVPDRH